MLTLRKTLKICQVLFLCFLVLVVRQLLELDDSVVDDDELFEALMKQRVMILQDQCQQRNISSGPSIKTGENLYILYRQPPLVWCPVFKAASTNWMYNMLPLAGLDDQDIDDLRYDFGYKHPNLVARQVAPVMPFSEIQKITEDDSSVRFLIVRHPFSRLLSAFRDKLERAKEHSSLHQDRYFTLYGRTIVSRYRDQAVAKFGEDFFSSDHHYGAPVEVTGRGPELPSWWEFVQWIIETNHRKQDWDEHWRPIR